MTFPLTNDLIPVMWSSGLRAYMATADASSNANISANARIYDVVSKQYGLYTRQNSDIARRITTAVRHATENDTAGKLHLDFGCGPGHVIDWLRDFRLISVGLDVSLENLRNVRQNTGALVVCGDATAMPFRDGSFALVTESSVLHHIEDWKAAVVESCRVCSKDGGVVLDSEPSREQMRWSPLAIAVFNARFPVYKVLSCFVRSKYMFRDIERAKLNLVAEIHHQPGTGFPLDDIEGTFTRAGFRVEIIRSPSPELQSVARPGWKGIVLNLLSARNPWDVKYGAFTAIAKRRGNIESESSGEIIGHPSI